MTAKPPIDQVANKAKVVNATLSKTSAVNSAEQQQKDSRARDTAVVPVQEQLAAGAKFLDNVLQGYDNVAYNFKLVMVNPALVENFDISQGIVLAQSGVTTDLVIKDCSFTHIVGWTNKAQGAFAHSGKMTIVEPLGVKVLDKRVTAARALRIPNHTQARYLLELTFNGRNKETGVEEIGITHHIWSIFFVKVQMKVGVEGGQYNIEFRNQLEAAQENIVENLKDIVNIPANTLRDYFAGLEKALNEREAKNVGITKFVPNEYKFVIDPEIAGYSFANFNPSQVSKSKNQHTKDGKAVASFREGTGILGLINVIMSGTDQFQHFQKQKSGDTKKTNETLATKKDKEQADVAADLAKFYRVQTWCECTDFDFFTKDYGKKLTFFVFPSLAPQIITPSEQDIASSKEYGEYVSMQKKAALGAQSLPAKSYDYMYTGMNTSVEDFDIQMNYSFYQALPPSDAGFVADASQLGKKMDPNLTPELLKDKQEVRKRWEANKVEITRLETQGKGTSSEAEKLKKEQQQLAGALTEEQALKKQALGPLRVFEQNQGRGYKEPRLHYVDDGEVAYINDSSLDPQFIVYRFLEDDVGTELTSGGVEGPYAKNRGAFAYVFNQLRQSGDLIQIKVRVVGDPYWFGRDNKILADLKKNVAGQKSIMTAQQSGDLKKQYADYEKGANYFYIKFQGPNDYNPATGYVEFDTNDVISGVYLVKTVTSTFEGGKFTQTLDAVKDMVIMQPFIVKTEKQFTKDRTDKLVTDKEFAQKNKTEVKQLADTGDQRAKDMLKKLK